MGSFFIGENMLKQKRKFEFSKIIMVSVMLTYFIALIFMMGVIWRLVGNGDTSIGMAISAFCTFVGAPVAVAIGFYSYKAKAENVAKLNNLNTTFTSEEYVTEEVDV